MGEIRIAREVMEVTPLRPPLILEEGSQREEEEESESQEEEEDFQHVEAEEKMMARRSMRSSSGAREASATQILNLKIADTQAIFDFRSSPLNRRAI